MIFVYVRVCLRISFCFLLHNFLHVLKKVLKKTTKYY